LENLLQTFRKRNEEYEKLLNETLIVNTRLFKNRRENIAKVKKKQKKKFAEKLNKFLLKKKNKKIEVKNDKKQSSGFLNFIKNSLQITSEKEKEIKEEKNNEKNSVLNKTKSLPDQSEMISYMSDENLKTIIKTLNNPRERKQKYFKPISSMSDDDPSFCSIEKNDVCNELLETKTFKNTHKNKKPNPILAPLEFDYESEVVRYKKISQFEIKESNLKLKNDLLVTTLDLPKGPTFGPDTPMQDYSLNDSDSPSSKFL
jgi:hypothetical protein